MAPKRPIPLENPPSVSSSEEEQEETSAAEEEDEEEEGSSSEEEEEEEEEEEGLPPQTQNQTLKKPDSASRKPNSESDSDSDSGSESGSDSDVDDNPKNAPDSTVKPIASKPMDGSPNKNTKPRSKPAAKSITTKTIAPKRGSEVDHDPKDSKRLKTKDPDTDGAVAERSEDTKKQLFQRLWSEGDEIALLKGIIGFVENKGIEPTKDMASFLDYIKESLHFDVSLAQLKDKVWRLKKKFENHVKGKKGEDKTFTKSHDQMTFDLSKKIWGIDGTIGALDAKSNGKAKKMVNSSNSNIKSLAALKAELGMDADKMVVEMDSHAGSKQLDKSLGVAGMEDYVVRRGLNMVEGAKKAEMEEKWRKLQVAELELFLKRSELICEQARLMLESYKNDSD